MLPRGWARIHFVCFAGGGVFDAICDDPQEQVFLQLCYALAFTIIAVLSVPSLRAAHTKMTKLHPACVEAFLKYDKDVMAREAVKGNVIESFYGIAIGWAW
jgi:hypothetical protein